MKGIAYGDVVFIQLSLSPGAVRSVMTLGSIRVRIASLTEIPLATHNLYYFG
jgi:hypothetical protein